MIPTDQKGWMKVVEDGDTRLLHHRSAMPSRR